MSLTFGITVLDDDANTILIENAINSGNESPIPSSIWSPRKS